MNIAFWMWQAGQVDCLLLCGGQVRGPVSEASVAARLCAEAGVPGHLLHLEDQSRDTLENLRNARPLLAQLSAGEVVLVTDPAHARRARLVAQRLGIEVRSACPEAPVRLRALLREALARLWYRWRLRGLS